MKGQIHKYYLYSFFSSFHFFSGVLIPFFVGFGHLTQFQIQTLQAWFSLWVFLLEVPTGAVADKFGRKFSIGLGSLVWGLGVLIYGSFGSFYVFMLGEFLLAVGLALQSGADEALLYDHLKEEGKEGEAKMVFGRARSFELLGIALSAPIGSFIAARFGVNVPMQFTACSMLLTFIFALSLKEPKMRSVSESKRYLSIVKNGFSFVKNHPLIKVIALDSILVASASYFVLWTYQRLLGLMSVPVIWFGFFHLFLTINQILVNNTYHHLEKFVGGTLGYLRTTAFLVGLSFILVGVFPNLFTVSLFILLAGGFGLTRLTYVSAHLNKLIPSQERATVLSSVSMFRRFFLIFLNPLVGYSIDRSLNLTLIGLSVIPLSLFLFSPLKKEMFSEDTS